MADALLEEQARIVTHAPHAVIELDAVLRGAHQDALVAQFLDELLEAGGALLLAGFDQELGIEAEAAALLDHRVLGRHGELELTLVFENAGEVTITVPVDLERNPMRQQMQGHGQMNHGNMGNAASD